jgi:hypothetical protein
LTKPTVSLKRAFFASGRLKSEIGRCQLKFKISPPRIMLCGDGTPLIPHSVFGVCAEVKIASASGSEIITGRSGD